jgi:hypothetical protein
MDGESRDYRVERYKVSVRAAGNYQRTETRYRITIEVAKELFFSQEA